MSKIMNSLILLTSWTRRLFKILFPDNALNRSADRPVVLRRIAKALRLRGVLDQYLGILLLGIIAGVCGTSQSILKGNEALSTVAEWFFRNATELNHWFVFWTLAVGSLLVLLHKPVEKQSWLRRLFFLPFLRMVGDAVLLALGAFTAAALITSIFGPVILGEGRSKILIDARSASTDAVVYLMGGIFTTICRMVTDSSIDAVLFKNVNRRDPGLQRTLLFAGSLWFAVFAVMALYLFTRAPR